MTGLMTEKITQVFAVFYILLNLLKIRHFAIYEYDNMTQLNTTMSPAWFGVFFISCNFFRFLKIDITGMTRLMTLLFLFGPSYFLKGNILKSLSYLRIKER